MQAVWRLQYLAQNTRWQYVERAAEVAQSYRGITSVLREAMRIVFLDDPALDGDFSSEGGDETSQDECETELEASFQRLRRLNEPLVLHVVGAYPGLLPGLFVHVIESIICLAGANEADDDGAIGRSITLLARWARYLLSREFHMHSDKSAALLPVDLPTLKKNTSLEPSVDLKKKGRKRWTSDEAEYMRGPVGRDALAAAGLPLNSVCDRLVDEVTSEEDGAAKKPVGGLARLLEGILGNDRVVGMGLPPPLAHPRRHAEGGELPRDQGQRVDGPSSGGDGAGGMSLEDMESMLRGDAVGDPDVAENNADAA